MIGNGFGILAALLTAAWAIHGRTSSSETVAAAFAIVGSAAFVCLATWSVHQKSAAYINVAWSEAIFLAVLLATYQGCLWAAFQFGSPVVQAIVNCNVIIIVFFDAAYSSKVFNTTLIVAAAVVQAAAGALLVYLTAPARDRESEDAP